MRSAPKQTHYSRVVCCLLLLSISVPFPLLAQAPLRAGDEYLIHIESGGISDIEAVTIQGGERYQLTHDGATYIAIHFAYFHLGADEVLKVSDANGGQSYELTGRGKMDAGTFWSQHIKGDTAVLELVSYGPRRARGFLVDRYVGGFIELRPSPEPEAICGLDDKENAVCYQASHPAEYDRGRAVSRLLIQGSSLCTGWLASANNHLLTNEHCITSATAALNTDYEFMSEAPTCGSSNCQLCWDGYIISGATFIQDNAALDYALVQITSEDPASTYGYLSIDNRDAIIGEEIYIPQHPGGRAKEFGIGSSDINDADGVCHVNTFASPCSGSGYLDVGYQCDTEGGSSGSPVLSRSSHKVIALHHCANCPNRGVPIDLVCAEICDLLGPECAGDADCDDGDACTEDSCQAGSCTHNLLPDCCGNGACEEGEDCNNCVSDCIGGSSSPGFCGDGICDLTIGEDCISCSTDCNGKQTGKPSDRFCCGDGAGVNPIDCSDPRCTISGYACGGSSGTGYCCGDAVCEGAEDSLNCEIDCGAVPICGDGNCGPTEDECSCSADCGLPPADESPTCTDNIDNDCDGDVDCFDSDCSADPACQADCSGIGDKKACNSEPQCRWDNRTKTCTDA